MPRRCTISFFFLTISLLLAHSTHAGDRYAFLVGVKQYDKTQLTSLNYTEADVTELSKALQKVGYQQQNIVLMTPTRGAAEFRYAPVSKQILTELDLLIGELTAEDTLLLAFSGHGVHFKGDNTVYFCPMDAKLDDPKTLISLTAIYDLLADKTKCKAQTKIMLVDACRNDPQSALSKAAPTIELEAAGITEQPEPPGGVAVFFSCSRGQKSYEHPDLGHGLFANFVIETFNGQGDLDNDGEISLAELEQYSVKQTQRYARLELRQRQTPERRGSVRGLVSLATISVAMPTAAGIEFVQIPAGSFRRGSEDGSDDEKPVRTIRISKPFYAGKYEVTIGQVLQWLNAPGVSIDEDWVTDGGKYSPVRKQGARWVMNSSSKFGSSESQPMHTISWDGAVAFCEWCSRQDPRFTYRLPTEAEWEYMAKAGSTTAYPWGDSLNGTRANVNGNYPRGTETKGPYREFTTNVGSYAANRFGLYDTVGNVLEWCSDWYDAEYYGNSPASDPTGPSSGSSRVLRGGSWLLSPTYARSANRDGYELNDRNGNSGFRVVAE